MNRGIGRRTIFENTGDFRFFTSRLAQAVRRHEIEVHAFCLVNTHFHMLVRSPTGRISEAMRRAQNEYVRRFNRQRRRDGPLFRGRFRSKLVDSLLYRHVLVRYIDANPVKAGVAKDSPSYPHGSARWYALRSGPPWLERSWVESEVQESKGAEYYDPKHYAACFGGIVGTGLARLVNLRIAGGHRGPDPIDSLLTGTTRWVLQWMQRKARLADGSEPGLAICDPASVANAVASGRANRGSWSLKAGNRTIDAWEQMHTGLLRDLAGLSASEIAACVAKSESGAGKMYRRHRAQLLADEDYAQRVHEVALSALHACGLPQAAAGVRSQDKPTTIPSGRFPWP